MNVATKRQLYGAGRARGSPPLAVPPGTSLVIPRAPWLLAHLPLCNQSLFRHRRDWQKGHKQKLAFTVVYGYKNLGQNNQ
jgi:hypothetical protein